MLDIRWNRKRNIQNYRVTALQLFPLPRIQCWMTLIMNGWDTVTSEINFEEGRMMGDDKSIASSAAPSFSTGKSNVV